MKLETKLFLQDDSLFRRQIAAVNNKPQTENKHLKMSKSTFKHDNEVKVNTSPLFENDHHAK